MSRVVASRPGPYHQTCPQNGPHNTAGSVNTARELIQSLSRDSDYVVQLAKVMTGSAIRALSRGEVGGGDVKMAALVGAVVGFPGIVAAGAVTAAADGLVAGILLMLRLRRWGDALPYGPFVRRADSRACSCE